MENKIFRKFLLAIICALCLSQIFFSCSYESRLEKWCARCPQPVVTQNNDSIKKEITRHDTDLDVKEKEGPNVVFNFGENCDSIKKAFEELKKNPITKIVNGIKTTIKSDGKKLTITSNEEAYRLRLNNAITKINLYKSAVRTLVIKEPCKNERTSLDGFFKWSAIFFYLCVVLVIIVLVIKHYYDRSKWHGPL